MCPALPSQPSNQHSTPKHPTPKHLGAKHLGAKQHLGGRPPALDATKREVAIALVAVGCSRAQAAKYLKVSPQTVTNTARRDPDFARRLDRAEAHLQFEHLRKIGNSAGRGWRASAWALQQMAPARFTGPKKRSSLTTLGAVLAEEVADPDLRKRLLGRLKSLFDE